MSDAAVCAVPGCGKPTRAKGRCGRCYARLLRAAKAGRPVEDPDFNAAREEPLVQLTIAVPIEVRDWLVTKGTPSAEARRTLIDAFRAAGGTCTTR